MIKKKETLSTKHPSYIQIQNLQLPASNEKSAAWQYTAPTYPDGKKVAPTRAPVSKTEERERESCWINKKVRLEVAINVSPASDLRAPAKIQSRARPSFSQLGCREGLFFLHWRRDRSVLISFFIEIPSGLLFFMCLLSLIWQKWKGATFYYSTWLLLCVHVLIVWTLKIESWKNE